MKMTRLPPIGFLSYARQDDKLSGQKLSRLRKLIKAELQLQFGREPVKLFQDVTTIPHGAKWERETLKALGESTFLVPIITPNFIQSEWCCREVKAFLAREQELFAAYPDLPQVGRIFPIDYRRIRDGNAHDAEALASLKTRQWFDFQELRDKDLEGEAVSRAISDFSESICDLLFLEVKAPPTPEEILRSTAEKEAARKRAEAARRQEAAEARKRARDEEQKQAADRAEADAAATRTAEAERKQAEDDVRRYAEEQADREAARLRAIAQAEAEERRRLQEEEAQARAEAERRKLERAQRERREAEAAQAAEIEAARAAQRRQAIEADRTQLRERWARIARRAALPMTVGILIVAMVVVALITSTRPRPSTEVAMDKDARPVEAAVNDLAGAGPATADLSVSPVADWLFHAWGMDRDCGNRLTISRGVGNSIRITSGGGAGSNRQIVGQPTIDRVATAEAIYTLRPDGTMRTTAAGMENWVNIRCD